MGNLKINLEEIGIEVTKDKHKHRTLTIRKIPANIADIVVSSDRSNDMVPWDDDNEPLPPAMKSPIYKGCGDKDDKDDIFGTYVTPTRSRISSSAI